MREDCSGVPELGRLLAPTLLRGSATDCRLCDTGKRGHFHAGAWERGNDTSHKIQTRGKITMLKRTIATISLLLFIPLGNAESSILQDSDFASLPTKECYQEPESNDCDGGQGNKSCMKSFWCTETSFKRLDDESQIYSKAVSTIMEFHHFDERGEESTDWIGNNSIFTVFKKAADGYVTLGDMRGSEHCSLSALAKISHGDVLLFRCEQSGTGHFFEEEYYLINDSSLQAIRFGEQESGLPHILFGYDSLSYHGGKFTLHSHANSRYDDEKASFDLNLALERDAEGGGTFKYVEGSFRPYFTSKSNARNQKGLAAYQVKNYSLAIREFTKAVELDVTNYEAYGNLGLAYLKIGDFKKAIEYSLITHNNSVPTPDGSTWFNKPTISRKASSAYNLGLAYEGLHDFDTALNYFSISNKLSPSPIKEKAIERVIRRRAEK
jgi:tetratricopeptide (TPR) repeat protein